MDIEDKKVKGALLIFLIMPILMAIVGVLVEFNIVDFAYLLVIGIICIRYIFSTRKL